MGNIDVVRGKGRNMNRQNLGVKNNNVLLIMGVFGLCTLGPAVLPVTHPGSGGTGFSAEPPPAARVTAPGPLSPEASATRLMLPKGFRIELVASEPVVSEPTCLAFDEQGRMFVCELHGFNLEGELDVAELNKAGKVDKSVRRIRWERQGGAIAQEARKGQYGTVKLLHDSDGDGRMDRADVWADRLPPCYGVLPARGGLVVVCAPDILFLADRDNDGKAEVRETLFTGFRREFIERGINNPRWGVDNWIYVGSGGDGGTIRGPKLARPVELGRGDFRIRPDGSAIEPVTGTVRTFGLALNDMGDRFTTAGGTPVSTSLPLPLQSLQRNPFVASPSPSYVISNYNRVFGVSPPHPWRVRRGQDPNWVKFYGNRETSGGYFTSGCGTEIYRAGLFPRKYHGNLFCCEPSNNVIHRSLLTRDGAGYHARRAKTETKSEFLASADPWFRPVNLRVGPGGELYIVDMYREIVEDYSAIPRFLQQQYGLAGGRELGRIWRMLPTLAITPQAAPLAGMTSAALVELFEHPVAWRRQTAQRLLVERGGQDAVAGLTVMLVTGDNAAARLHALYSLQGLGALETQHLVVALEDIDYGVRTHALRLSESQIDTDTQLLETATQLVADKDPRVRLQLAMTLGGTDKKLATAALLRLARERGHERWMPAAILSSARTRPGVLLSDLLKDGQLKAPAGALILPLSKTVSGGGDGRQLASVLHAAAGSRPALQQDCLKGLVAGFTGGKKLARGSRESWSTLAPLVKSDSGEIRRLSIQLATRLGFSDRPEIRQAFVTAAATAIDKKQPLPLRVEALQLMRDAPFSQLQGVATNVLRPETAPALQRAAIGALEKSTDKRSADVMLKGWSEFTPALRSAALEALFAREERLITLITAVKQGVVDISEINVALRERLLESRVKAVASQARRLLASRQPPEELQKRMAGYQSALTRKRDLARGRVMFAKHCLACHKLKQEGHAVGPPLESVLRKPDEAILLELLNPSESIEPQYRSYTVVTESGRVVTGILASESATSLTLRREKGMTDTVLRREVETIKASNVSLMPSNLYQQINPADMADLLGYLRQALKK